MTKKYLIFDSGPLINFAMNGLLPLLRELKKEFKGDFLITKEVKKEIIDYPLTIKRFELEAMQIKQLFEEGIIKHADLTEDQIETLRQRRDYLMNLGNSTFYANNREVHLLDKGECAAFALYEIIEGDKVLVIDERTARMLSENPENLKRLLEKKLHTQIIPKRKNYEEYRKFRVIRSAELAYIIVKKKLNEIKDPNLLDAMLYGLKYKGCSISENEISELKRL